MYWICFEAEMKVQIWESQYQTYESLMVKHDPGYASQLNMGEGKTQTIIPMIVLELIFGNNHQLLIPRVNILNALFNEAKVNYFKFLSATAFNIPIVELPFDRKVKFDNPDVRNKIMKSLSHFKDKMMLLLDQSSTHSLILKLR